MASLILGVAGKSIGGAIGGALGASIGWGIGTMIGGYLSAPDLPDIQGPRLNDLKLQTSTYGAPIPKVYGTVRIAGNVIWSSGIQETTHTQEVGGKGGGGSQTQTTYTYSASFAIGLCEGEIVGIRKIWLDSVLFYNVGDGDDADALAVSQNASLTVYQGTEDQSADPLIQADKGAANTPAFRGLAYIVFDDLQLEKYGNRIPNVTCEVVTAGGSSVTAEVLHTTEDLTQHSDTKWERHRMVYLEADGTAWMMEPLGFGTYWPGNIRIYTVTPSGAIAEELTIPKDNIGSSYYSDSAAVLPILSNSSSGKYGIFINSGNNAAKIVNVETGGIAGGYDKPTELPGSFSNRTWIAFTENNSYLFGVSSGATSVTMKVLKGTNIAQPNTVIITKYFTHLGFDFTVGLDGYIYIVDFEGTGVTTSATLYKYDQEGTSISTTDITFQYSVTCKLTAGGHEVKLTVDGYGTVIFLGEYAGGRSYVLIGTTAMYLGNLVYQRYSLQGGAWSNSNIIVASTGYTTDNTRFLRFSKPTSSLAIDFVLVKNIIEAICDIVGPSVDASTVTSEVIGYIRTHPMKAADVLSPLLQAYNIGAVEVDNLLKFFPLDGTVDETILEGELAAGENEQEDDALVSTRTQLSELPKRVTVSYSDIDADHQVVVQSAKRVST